MGRIDDREMLIRKLLKELPAFIDDYEHCAVDEEGHLDADRRKMIKRLRGLVFRLRNEAAA